MAQNFEKKINDAIEEIVNNYREAAKIAAQYATKVTEDAIYKEALWCFKKYYMEYPTSSYERMESAEELGSALSRSCVPFSSVKASGKKIACTMGVYYDPSLLTGLYDKTRGENYKSYNPPDSQWIINNYLAGLHPRTKGSQISSVAKSEYTSESETFYPTPTDRMRSFLTPTRASETWSDTDNKNSKSVQTPQGAYNVFVRSFNLALIEQVIKHIK